MKLHTSNEHCFATVETARDKSTLYCFSDCADTAAVRELPGKVTGIVFHGDKLLCIAQYREADTCAEYLILHAFDTALHELSSKKLTGGEHHLFSALDATAAYILHTSIGSTTLTEDDGRWFDVLMGMAFTKIDISTGERAEWELDDDSDNACSDALARLTDGYVTRVNSLCAHEGQLVLSCNVYDPDSLIETDDPDFDESTLDDGDYVEWHSFESDFVVRFEERQLSAPPAVFYSEMPCYSLMEAGWKYKILNVVSLGTKTYVATDVHILCIDSWTGGLAVSRWNNKGIYHKDEEYDDPEEYRCFYAWGEKLVFETRKDGKLLGFRACPAVFDEPDAQAWTYIRLK